MRTKRWNKQDLTLIEVENGLLVKQAGRTYRSSKWRLTDQLIDLVNIGLEFDLCAQWQSGHPSDAFFESGPKFRQGIHHISFAPTHSHKWIFVIGHEGVKKPWGDQFVEYVTVNKKYRNFVARSGVGWKWEVHRGKNIFVSTENLRDLLTALSPEIISAVEVSGRSEIPWKREITGIDSEKHLEEILVEFLGGFYTKRIQRLDVRPNYEGRFPDIICLLNDRTRLVMELKLDKPGEAGLQQIREYLALDSLKNGHGGELYGALVCRDFEPDVINLSQSRVPKISLYRYDYTDKFSLSLIAGEDILANDK